MEFKVLALIFFKFFTIVFVLFAPLVLLVIAICKVFSRKKAKE